jgi:hypothetical protein
MPKLHDRTFDLRATERVPFGSERRGDRERLPEESKAHDLINIFT